MTLTIHDLRSELQAFGKATLREELAELGSHICERIRDCRISPRVARHVHTASDDLALSRGTFVGNVPQQQQTVIVASKPEYLNLPKGDSQEQPHAWTQRHMRTYHARAELRIMQSECELETRHQKRNSIRNAAITNVAQAPLSRSTSEPCWGEPGSSPKPPRVSPPCLNNNRTPDLDPPGLVIEDPPAEADIQGGLATLPAIRIPANRSMSASDDSQSHIASADISDSTSTKRLLAVKHCHSSAWSSPMLPSTNEDPIKMSKMQNMMEGILLNSYFQLAILTLIVCSAAETGAQVDFSARQLDRSAPLAFRVIGCALAALLGGEMCVRLYTYRVYFFRMGGWAWNVFDLVVAIAQIAEVVNENVNDAGASWFVLSRILCLTRLLRVMRYLFAKRYFGELRCLIHCFLGSARAFVWTFLIILLVIYCTSVLFTELVMASRIDPEDGVDEVQLERWYGSLPRSMLTLYEALLGGVDWDGVVVPLFEVSPWLGIAFFLYIAVAVFLLFNVVTGVFLDIVMTRAHRMHDAATVNTACRLFSELDLEHTGKISEREFESQLNSKPMQEYLSEIDVDVTEAKWLFEILDINDSGSIDFEEFLSGCLRLRGPAKALDLLLVTREIRRMFQQLISERKDVASRLAHIMATIRS